MGDDLDRDEDEIIDIEKIITTIYERLLLLKEEILERDGDPDYIINGPSGLDSLIDEFKYFEFTDDYNTQVECADNILNELYDFADWNFIWLNQSDLKMDGIGKP